jgi:hypothetical protein
VEEIRWMAAKRRTFYQRFDIDINLDEARAKFVESAHNRIFDELYHNPHFDSLKAATWRYVADKIGKRPQLDGRSLSRFIGDDFFDVLKAMEGMFVAVVTLGDDSHEKMFNHNLNYVLEISDIDLGIRWEPPEFQRAGAEELDRALVNENLLWLGEKGYDSVVKPFKKGLRHLMESRKRPELLSDVVRDMYESVEALAKIVTGRDADLSKNAELLINNVKASVEYKSMLKHYIDYANRFRHAPRANQPRPSLSGRETESFVYLTGLFIRLAMPPH